MGYRADLSKISSFQVISLFASVYWEVQDTQADLYNGDDGERVGFATYSPPSIVDVEQNTEVSGGNRIGFLLLRARVGGGYGFF